MDKPTKDRSPGNKIRALRAAAEAGDWVAALRIAARFPRLGAHRLRIGRGWAAHTAPAFYASLGYDPRALESDGIAAVRERYGL